MAVISLPVSNRAVWNLKEVTKLLAIHTCTFSKFFYLGFAIHFIILDQSFVVSTFLRLSPLEILCLLGFSPLLHIKRAIPPLFGIMSSTKTTFPRKELYCSWTLYSILSSCVTSFISKTAGCSLLSADISLLSSGPSMIPILQSTKNTGWTNLRSSAMSALLRRTGIGRIF